MELSGWIGADLREVFLSCFISFLLTFAAAGAAWADSGPFDLIGPGVQVRVTRGGKTLPISSVPNLESGDKLWIHADFPEKQSARYLLIVGFLQGPTNPPPDNWFTQVETWTKQAREDGALVTVPQNAQQALLFLAPETGGAFATLRSTVRGKPGVFVRASQDLEQASLDRTRLDKFMSEIRQTSGSDLPLAQRVALLSRTLAVKADPQCFEKPIEQQSSCLTQDTDHLTLLDTHNQSMVAMLTSGASADLVGTMSNSPMAAKGYYSPYVGSAMDIVRLLNGLHTPELQFLPALVLPKEDNLNLRLNAPPSFSSPRSVLVVGLPAVREAPLPLLRSADPKQVLCAQSNPLVLPAAGEPLVFSTDMGHDFAFHLQSKSGDAIELPATADAVRGGFTVDTHNLRPDELGAEAMGTLHGLWGFEAYEGPSFTFRSAQPAHWTIPTSDAESLVIGREDTVHLESGSTACVEKVSAVDAEGNDLKATWKALKPGELELRLPLKDEAAGTVKLAVKQFGLASPDSVTLHSYSEAAHLDGFTINAGDRQGVLTGTRLDEVSGFELSGIHFVPAKLTRVEQKDSLGLMAPSAASTAALAADAKLVAHVALKDGRVLDLQTTIEPARPKVTLVSKNARLASAPPALRLGDENELPQDGQLSFLLKTEVPEKFPHDEEIEVATTDGSSDALLSLANGGLVLQDAENVLATLEPFKNLGASAFGPLQFRPVDAGGGKGDWQPLAKLVRIPGLKEVRCPDAPEQPCVLSGSNLFLLDSVASDPQFKDAISVPAGYADVTLNVPRPDGTLLYVKLRDDPATVDTVSLPVLPQGY